VLPAIEAVFEALVSALVDALDGELGGSDDDAIESVDLEYVSLGVVLDAVPGAR
jgi:hypothetical protein